MTSTEIPTVPAHERRKGAGRRRSDRIRNYILRPEVIAGVIVTLGMAYLVLVPLGFLLHAAFFAGARPSIEFFRKALDDPAFGKIVLDTIFFTVGSTVIAMVVGLVLAFLAARTDLPFKSLIFLTAMGPLILPGILHTIAWILLASPRAGLVNEVLASTIGQRPLDIFTVTGMAVVEGLHSAPVVFLLMYAAFSSVDPSLEDSAAASGATRVVVLWRITGPLLKPALLGALVITLIRSVESFEVPVLLGLPSGTRVLTSQIWQLLNSYPQDFGQASAYAMVLLIIAVVAVYWQTSSGKNAKAYQTVTGKGFRPRRMELGKWRWFWLAVVIGYTLLAVVLPLAILVYASLQPFYTHPTWDGILNVSFASYHSLLTDSSVLHSAKNSLILGIGAATLVMFTMAIAAWVSSKSGLRGKMLLEQLAAAPLAIPGLVLGVALLFVYLRVPMGIYGTMWILLIAYCTRYLPYGFRYASTSMQQIAGELEESGRASGGSWWQVFRRISLPLLMPGLLAGWVYILIVSVRELSSSLLIYSPGNEVLAIKIWQEWQDGQLSELAALGIVMVISIAVLILIARKLGSRVGLAER